MAEIPSGAGNKEGQFSKEYGELAQNQGVRFVTMLEAQGFSPNQIKSVLGLVQSSYGMDAEHTKKPPVIGSPSDTNRLQRATDWVSEVTSRAQFALYNKAGQKPDFFPSRELMASRPTNRKP